MRMSNRILEICEKISSIKFPFNYTENQVQEIMNINWANQKIPGQNYIMWDLEKLIYPRKLMISRLSEKLNL